MLATEIVKFKYYSRMHHKRIFLYEDYDYEVISILQDNTNPENLIWRTSYIRDERQITEEILVPEYEGENEEEIPMTLSQLYATDCINESVDRQIVKNILCVNTLKTMSKSILGKDLTKFLAEFIFADILVLSCTSGSIYLQVKNMKECQNIIKIFYNQIWNVNLIDAPEMIYYKEVIYSDCFNLL